MVFLKDFSEKVNFEKNQQTKNSLKITQLAKSWHVNIMLLAGGDDVQQLCEAGEEEFLEIMALVGMASKPLHVRRLQKSLQEWVANPCMLLRLK